MAAKNPLNESLLNGPNSVVLNVTTPAPTPTPTPTPPLTSNTLMHHPSSNNNINNINNNSNININNNNGEQQQAVFDSESSEDSGPDNPRDIDYFLADGFLQQNIDLTTDFESDGEISDEEVAIERRRKKLETLRSLYRAQAIRLRDILETKHRKFLKLQSNHLRKPPKLSEATKAKLLTNVNRTPGTYHNLRQARTAVLEHSDTLHKIKSETDNANNNTEMEEEEKFESSILAEEDYTAVMEDHQTFNLETDPELSKLVANKNCSMANCDERAVPLTQFCYFHILNDKHQVLFRPCYYVSTLGHRCEYPVMVNSAHEYCSMHQELAKSTSHTTLPSHPAATLDPYINLSSGLQTFPVNTLHQASTLSAPMAAVLASQPTQTNRLSSSTQPAGKQSPVTTSGQATYQQIPYQSIQQLVMPSRMYMSPYLPSQVVMGVPSAYMQSSATTPRTTPQGTTTTPQTLQPQAVTNPTASSIVVGQIPGTVTQTTGTQGITQGIYQLPSNSMQGYPYYPYSPGYLYKSSGQIYGTNLPSTQPRPPQTPLQQTPFPNTSTVTPHFPAGTLPSTPSTEKK